jgi:hypothetical protein
MPSANTKPTKTGKYVLELQKELPKARIVYASATGASEPRNMAYMVRLGLWGKGQAFTEFADFISAVEDKGIGSIELIAIDMKVCFNEFSITDSFFSCADCTWLVNCRLLVSTLVCKRFCLTRTLFGCMTSQ